MVGETLMGFESRTSGVGSKLSTYKPQLGMLSTRHIVSGSNPRVSEAKPNCCSALLRGLEVNKGCDPPILGSPNTLKTPPKDGYVPTQQLSQSYISHLAGASSVKGTNTSS